jgi:hypothetical protein
MLGDLVNNLDIAIAPFFTTDELDQLARDSQFVKRAGKINGSLFFELLVFHSERLKSESLNDLSVDLKLRHGVEISRQSLHERFNQSALVFLVVALEELLQKQLNLEICNEFEGFKRILIKDSTCFQVDESLEVYYPGSGGSGSSASIRIQFEYDLLTGTINDISINAFNDQDAKDSIATIELTQAGDLVIRDLAYMGLDVLREIEKRCAYYLCRPSPSVKICEKRGDDYVDLNFDAARKHMKKHGLQTMEKEVYLGKKDRFKTRLVLHYLPEEVISRRIRKARASNKKHGRGELTKEYIARAHLNLFITNASVELISAKSTWALYRLRWQIELIFKVWKSICNVADVKKVTRYRLECYLYAKLILIVIGWQVIWRTAAFLFIQEGKIISFFKAAKTLFKKQKASLAGVFMLNTIPVSEFMATYYNISRSNHLLERRLGQPNSFELLLESMIRVGPSGNKFNSAFAGGLA